MEPGCLIEHVGLVLIFLALLISVCLNVILCIRGRASLCGDKDDCCSLHIYEGEGPSQDEGNYFHHLNLRDQQENPRDHRELQENPIYGNISSDRGDVCYEMMTVQHTRDRLKSLEADVNYASLDLKMAKKRNRKHRHQRDQAQLTVHPAAPVSAFPEVEGDPDAHLPPRDTSTMVSHSSIYLNSQQIAQETEEMERGRAGVNEERGGAGWEEDGGARERKGGQESAGGKDRGGVGNATVCLLLADIQAVQSGSDHFISSLCPDRDQQD